jgi:hypothetical protein
MNLLTDIETLAMSSPTATPSSALKHEIELLIDECLCLVNSAQTDLADFYQLVFESWLSSSKDSPILIHFVNRLSRNYDLFQLKQTEKYASLLEICLEVYFDNRPTTSNSTGNDHLELNLLLANSTSDLGQFGPRSAWRLLMENIEFKLNNEPHHNDETLFEFGLLRSSSYMLLNCYMSQRLSIYKAVYPERGSVLFTQTLLKYTDQIVSSFFLSSPSGGEVVSKPRAGKEEKFLLILNKLVELYLLLALNVTGQNALVSVESRIGEQLAKLCQLLVYYGEDSLSSQNPLNDSQGSMGSDLLSSIGLNILAKKSPLSLKFRFFCKCMAICLLKQILIVNNEPSETGASNFRY